MGPSRGTIAQGDRCKSIAQRDCRRLLVRSTDLSWSTSTLTRSFKVCWEIVWDGDERQIRPRRGEASQPIEGRPSKGQEPGYSQSSLDRPWDRPWDRPGRYLGKSLEDSSLCDYCYPSVISAGHYLDLMCAASIKFDRWHHILQKALQWCNNAQKFGRMSSARRWF
jgi:hypothetical protein